MQQSILAKRQESERANKKAQELAVKVIETNVPIARKEANTQTEKP